MDYEKMISYAVDEGFSAAAVINTKDIIFDPSFRPYCEENLCGKYSVNYSCPPACGTPEEMKQKALRHRKALVLQTIWEISDYSDHAAIKASKGMHNAKLVNLAKRLRAEGCSGLIAGSGGCSLCNPCNIVNGEPCRFPDLQFSCLSAYCIFVKKAADLCGLEYNCGDGLVALFGMYFFD